MYRPATYKLVIALGLIATVWVVGYLLDIPVLDKPALYLGLAIGAIAALRRV
jgi:hypothetical protein